MDVFISYKSEEYTVARDVKEYLNKNGITTWMAPESIPGGKTYLSAIPTAISKCKLLVLILSQKCQSSQWILMEIENALKKEKIIIPYVIEQFSYNETFDFVLSLPQRINAFTNGQASLKKLVSDVKKALGEEITDTNPEEKPKSDDQAYVGDMKDGKRHGKGTLKFSNGDLYEGEFSQGKMTGVGRYTFANGDVYDGQFRNGVMNGKGTYKWSNGNSYTGMFRNGKRTGPGKYVWQSGCSYEGDFLGNNIDGKGIYRFADGSFYEGVFSKGKITGTGIYTDKDGKVYEGSFKDGEIVI